VNKEEGTELRMSRVFFCEHTFTVVTKKKFMFETSGVCFVTTRFRYKWFTKITKTFKITNIKCPFFVSTSFFCVSKEEGTELRMSRVFFCKHTFTVVTRKRTFLFRGKKTWRWKTRVRDVKSLFCDHPFPVVHFSSAEGGHEVRMSGGTLLASTIQFRHVARWKSRS
jgi:hypothetical protein